MWKIFRLLPLVLLLTLLLSCDGSAAGHSQSCRSTTSSGSCTGSYRTIKGRYHYSIELTQFPRDTPVQVEMTASIESGRLRMGLVEAAGQVAGSEVSVVALPGTPATLTGITPIAEFESARISLEAMDEAEVSGVEYTVSWVVQ